MIDTNAVRENLQEWLENPYWAAYYNEAPSEACKAYVALSMYASDTEDEEAWEEMDAIEPRLSLEDWKHLLKYCGETPEKAKIARKIAEMEAAG